MAYRNGTYVAFNGCSTSDPTKSDIKYYNLIKAWNNNKDVGFDFINSHEKNSQVRDTSKKETLLRRLEERMKNSKNLLVVITENSNANRELLNWEIEKCVITYKLPIIVAYTMCESKLSSLEMYKKYWPSSLKKLTDDEAVKTIHIPFRKLPILSAIKDYTHRNKPTYTISLYNAKTYKDWGIA